LAAAQAGEPPRALALDQRFDFARFTRKPSWLT
jgi:hypothetical protein